MGMQRAGEGGASVADRKPEGLAPEGSALAGIRLAGNPAASAGPKARGFYEGKKWARQLKLQEPRAAPAYITLLSF
jgi:hypothetical protein